MGAGNRYNEFFLLWAGSQLELDTPVPETRFLWLKSGLKVMTWDEEEFLKGICFISYYLKAFGYKDLYDFDYDKFLNILKYAQELNKQSGNPTDEDNVEWKM